MKKISFENKVDIVKVSSKGQVVLPKSLREKLDIKKDSFVAMTNVDGAVILKKIQGMSRDDYETLVGVAEAWKQIKDGKCRTYTKEDFLKKLKEW